MTKLEAIGMLRRCILFIAVLCIWILASTSCGLSGQKNTVGTSGSILTTKVENTSASPSPLKVMENLEKDVQNAKADNYYEIQFVEKYVEGTTYAINNNHFELVKDRLVQESSLYFSEKKFVEDNYKKGVKYSLIYLTADDIKKNIENKQYEVFATIKLEITNPDGTTEKKILKKVYTVRSDNNVKKITDIRDWN
jgi:hypothetical protein